MTFRGRRSFRRRAPPAARSRATTDVRRQRTAEFLDDDRRALHAAVASSRVARIADRGLSLGIGQRGTEALVARAEARGLPTTRRTTGGTGVLHDAGDLAWSIVLPRTDPRVGRDFTRAYARWGAAVAGALSEAEVPAAWVPGLALSESFCLFGARAPALAVGERVIGGAAQHATKEAVLHHGVLLVDVDRPLLAELFELPAALLETRLLGLREVASELDVDAWAETLATRLAAWLGPADPPARTG